MMGHCVCGWGGPGPCPCPNNPEYVRQQMAQPTQPMRMPAYGTPDLGWQCPVCRKVHAPFMPSCDCHEPKETPNANR